MSSSSQSSEFPFPIIVAGRALCNIKEGEKIVYDPPCQIVTSGNPPTVSSYKEYWRKHKGKRRK